MIFDDDINGGEGAARCETCGSLDCAGRREAPAAPLTPRARPESFAEARAFVVTASADTLREMRANPQARGFGDTPGLDELIKERDRNR